MIINSLLSPSVGGGLLENGLFFFRSKIVAHGKKRFYRDRGMFSLVNGRKELEELVNNGIKNNRRVIREEAWVPGEV